MNDEELKKRLAETFREEASEHIRNMSAGLLDLEKFPDEAKRKSLIEGIFREAHNLKGAARLVGAHGIEQACQSLEESFANLKRNNALLTQDLLQSLYAKVRNISRFHTPSATPRTAEATSRTPSMGAAASSPQQRPADRQKKQSPNLEPALSLRTSDQVRVPAQRLDGLLYEAEELLSTKLALGDRVAELQQLEALLRQWRRDWTKIRLQLRNSDISSRSSIDSENRLGSLLEAADTQSESLNGLQNRLSLLTKRVAGDYHILDTGIDRLLTETKEILMLPFSFLLEGFPNLVQDLSQFLGKQASLSVQGSEIEIGKRILEELRDPLIHLVRNSLDHGIEKPETRKALGKPEIGSITILVTQKSGQRVEVAVSDDGAGVDPAEVKANAARLGLAFDEASNPSPEQVFDLLFHSGFSTRRVATEVSGRGLGLSIVRENVERLGGRIVVESQPKAGTTFRLDLPNSLTRFRGVLVRVAEQCFVIPSFFIEHLHRTTAAQVKTVAGRESITLRDTPIGLLRLADALGIPQTPSNRAAAKTFPVLVIASAQQRIALAVDEVVHEQDVVMKPLSRRLNRLRQFGGATILANGSVALVLNGSHLVARFYHGSAAAAPVVKKTAQVERQLKILLAEDSITSRTLLRSILQGAGYEVKVAVDGLEAWTFLKFERFDLVVSDVQMPRLDGFELTGRIRSDPELRNVPVILITSLSSREDKEKGVEAGASAYVVKSALDQGHLLETIRRLAR